MQEIWKDIVGYEGLYQVSNIGRVKSIKRDKILKEQLNERGYLRVSLSKNGKHKTWRVHRLVMITFIGYVEGKDQVNHIDGDKTNNRLDNLEYVTPKENTNRAWKKGIAKYTDERKEKLRKIALEKWKTKLELLMPGKERIILYQ